MADFTALKTAIQNAIKQNGNEEITGDILQGVLLSMVNTLGDSAINDLVSALANEVTNRQNADGTLQTNITNEATARGNADTALGTRIDNEVTARENADTALSNRITAITDAIDNGYVYAGIATTSTEPATGKVFYLTTATGVFTNFGGITVNTKGIKILKMVGSTWTSDTVIVMDDTPTENSTNLVKSGGVFNDILTNGSAFDLSAYNNGTTYANLNAALTALNALPAAYKRGGMSMKFVQSSDNKYVQFRCMAQNFTTDVTQWQGVDDEPTDGSNNLVKSGGVVYSLCEQLAWQLKVGGISTDGSNNDSNERIRTENWLELPIGSIIELSGSVDGQITVYEYNAYGSYEKVTKSDSWNVKQITTSAKWIRFVFMYLDSRVCTNTDAQIVKNSIKIIKKDAILTNDKVDKNSAGIYILPSNLKSNMEVGNIAMSDSGWTYTDSTTRVRTKENYVLNLPKGVTVKATGGLRFALNYKYIDRGVTKYALSYWQSEFIIPVDCECVFIMEVTNNVDYAFNNIHINKTDGIGEKVVNIDKKVETFLPQFGNVEYYGKRLTLESLKREKNFCDITKLHQVLWTEDEEPMSITTNKLVDLQSSAIYKNYVFNFLDGGDCYVITLDTHEFVGIFSTGLSGWHMNNAQFSNIFYTPNDDYPLLLVSNGGELSQGTNGSCAYLRIQESNGTFTFTKVMDIQVAFDKSRHIGTFVADWYTKKLWLYCYEQNWSPNTIYNPIYFVEYELPEFVDGGNITLENSAIIRTTIYPMYDAYIQGGITFNGKILIGTRCNKPSSGLTNEENEATNEDYINVGDMFFVLDQGTLSLETFIPVKDPANHEIEGISLYEDKIYLTERSGGRTNDYHTTAHTKQIYTLLKYEFS